MKRLALVVSTVAVVTATTSVFAQTRPDTRALTCGQVKGIVARDHTVELASSDTAYETVHLESMACDLDETGAPAFMPSSDDSHCLAGWRCKPRSNDGQGR